MEKIKFYEDETVLCEMKLLEVTCLSCGSKFSILNRECPKCKGDTVRMIK